MITREDLYKAYLKVGRKIVPKETEDSSVYYGRITRAGPFKYEDGIKFKKYENIKEELQKLDHLPVFGSQTYGSHDEALLSTKLVGFLTNWDLKEESKDAFADLYFFKDIKELSSLKDPTNLPISLKYGDMGQGQEQVIRGIHHGAISLNKLEDDRCGLDGLGESCNMSPKQDNLTINRVGSDSYDQHTQSTNISTITDVNPLDITTDVGNVDAYQKLNNNLSELNDMTENINAGKPTPNENEISKEIEGCLKTGKTQDECKAGQKRVERTGKEGLEVKKMAKDLADEEITLEDLVGLIEENEALKEENTKYKENSSDFTKRLKELEDFQSAQLKKEEARREKLLIDVRADLIKIGLCEDFVNNRELESLQDWKVGFDGIEEAKVKAHFESLKEDAEDDEEIITSLADMGTKIDNLKEGSEWMVMK